MSNWGEEDDLVKMERLKAQAQHHQRTLTPALSSQYAYYRDQSEDKSLPAGERKLWAQLADELATRLGLNAPPSKQEELFPLT